MKKQNSGSALLLSMILLFVVLSLVTSLSYVTVMEQKMSQKTKSSVGAFYNADSGVEWALNKIATTSGTLVSDAFGTATPGNGVAPSGVTEYKIYLLDDQGNVITTNAAISEIKAVRAVGTQNTGEATQRAIEAAVGGSSEKYQTSCVAYGIKLICCRLDKTSGAVKCKASTNPPGVNAWDTNRIDPWAASASSSSYQLDCGYGGGSYFACCRTDAISGTVECKYNTDYVSTSTWTAMNSPW